MLRREYKDMMDQLSPREELVEQVLSQAGTHTQPGQKRRRPMHKKKLILALAAALVVLTGSAVAVGSQLGLLHAFFQGDTSGLEPYVQTDLGSAENEDFRFTVNSAYYDGMTVYATVTLEGLNEAAVDDLMHSRSDAELHREIWGDEMADNMLETGKSGPDTIMCNQKEVTEAAGYEYTGGGIGGSSLPAPSDTSRSWKVHATFERWIGPMDTPLELWVGFMGREYSVEIPLDTVVGSAHLETDQEFLFNSLNGQRAILTEATLTPTQLYYEIQSVGEMKTDTGWDATGGRFVLKMKDGSLITSSQLEGLDRTHFDWNSGVFIFQIEFVQVNFSDVSEVESIIFGDTEFPLDGSEPTLANEEERLYPFYVPRYQYDGSPFYTDVEALCRGLGAEYTWDADTQTATMTYRDVTIQMTMGESQALVDGEPLDLCYKSWVEETGEEVTLPLPIRMEAGSLVAPSLVLQEPWSIDISFVHINGSGDQDPSQLVVLP